MKLQYLLLPLEQHSDFGFGATAHEYEEAGVQLASNNDRESLLELLPACFLLRHSSELYLKSAIIILHKGFKIPFVKDDPPTIEFNDRNENIYSMHSLKDLFTYFSTTLENYSENIQTKALSDWRQPPIELIEAINRIELLDRKSSYFRYPITKNNKIDPEKSPMRKMEPEQIVEKMQKPAAPLVFAFILTDDHGNATEAYIHSDEHNGTQLVADLKYVSETLGGLSVGLRVELLSGK